METDKKECLLILNWLNHRIPNIKQFQMWDKHAYSSQVLIVLLFFFWFSYKQFLKKYSIDIIGQKWKFWSILFIHC